jgi:hypothetical protein
MPDQKPASGGHTTGKSASADLRDELTKLMNYQRHGKPITKFQAEHIAPELMHYIQKSAMPIKEVIGELERQDDPAYKYVSDRAADVMRHVWDGSATTEWALYDVTKSMHYNAPDAPVDNIEDIAQSLTAGKSPAECLSALKRYFEALHPVP